MVARSNPIISPASNLRVHRVFVVNIGPMSQAVISKTAADGTSLSARDVQSLIEQVCTANDYRRKRVLLIVPDGTRTAPIGLLFKTLHDQIGVAAKEVEHVI